MNNPLENNLEELVQKWSRSLQEWADEPPAPGGFEDGYFLALQYCLKQLQAVMQCAEPMIF